MNLRQRMRGKALTSPIDRPQLTSKTVDAIAECRQPSIVQQYRQSTAERRVWTALDKSCRAMQDDGSMRTSLSEKGLDQMRFANTGLAKD